MTWRTACASAVQGFHSTNFSPLNNLGPYPETLLLEAIDQVWVYIFLQNASSSTIPLNTWSPFRSKASGTFTTLCPLHGISIHTHSHSINPCLGPASQTLPNSQRTRGCVRLGARDLRTRATTDGSQQGRITFGDITSALSKASNAWEVYDKDRNGSLCIDEVRMQRLIHASMPH